MKLETYRNLSLLLNQLSLFNDAKKECNSNIDEHVIEEVCSTRKKTSKNIAKKDNLRGGLEKFTLISLVESLLFKYWFGIIPLELRFKSSK